MITVNCKDGKIQIGGNFDSAKAIVKAMGGKFDWNSKEWTVTCPVKEFDPLRIGLPVDVISGEQNGRMASGNHATRYGNVYSRNEWNATQEAGKVSLHEEYQPKHDALKNELRAKLTAFNPASADRLYPIISGLELDIYIEQGVVQFTSPEREQALRAIEDWFCDAQTALFREQDDREQSIKEAIFEKHGVS